jgi:hypothetical protein
MACSMIGSSGNSPAQTMQSPQDKNPTEKKKNANLDGAFFIKK